MNLRRRDVSDDVLRLNPDLFPAAQAGRGGLLGQAERTFAFLFGLASSEELVPEYEFHEAAHWRFDFAHPSTHVAVEIDGGIWIQGRHTRGAGFIEDCRKLNAAAAAGWRVFRFPAHKLTIIDAEMVAQAIQETLRS